MKHATVSPQNAAIFERLGWADMLSDFLDYAHGTLAAKTEAHYRGRLKLLLDWACTKGADGKGVRPSEFTARHMRQFVALRADHINPQTGRNLCVSTRRHDVVAAKVFFQFCHGQDHLEKNPLLGFKVMKQHRPYVPVPDHETLQRILYACRDRWDKDTHPEMRFQPDYQRRFLARRDYAIVAGLLQTAMRAGELFALKLDDLRLASEHRHAVIQTSKGKEPRYVPLEDSWIGIVQEYLEERRGYAQSDHLFVTLTGGQMHVQDFRRRWYRILKAAGTPHFSLHSLRHYSLTCLAETNKWGAQQIAGHKDGKTTDLYLKANTKHLQKVMDEAAPLSRLLKGRDSKENEPER